MPSWRCGRIDLHRQDIPESCNQLRQMHAAAALEEETAGALQGRPGEGGGLDVDSDDLEPMVQ